MMTMMMNAPQVMQAKRVIPNKKIIIIKKGFFFFFIIMDKDKDTSLLLGSDARMGVRNQDLERISAMISLSCWSVVGLCIFSSLVMGVTLLLPGAVPIEKQIFVGLACLAVLCPVIVLACARRNPSALVVFSIMAAVGAGMLIGVGAMMLAPHVVVPITSH